MSAGNLAVDVLLGDEKRAGETIYNALTGRPVSAQAAVDAAVTIGSDLLMLIPGVGAAGAAIKAGRTAKAAGNAAKTVRSYQKASKSVKEAKGIIKFNEMKKGKLFPEGTPGVITGETVKEAVKTLAKNSPKKLAKAGEKAAKAVKKQGGKTLREMDKVYSASSKAAKEYRKKYNSPRRKKMRHIGMGASLTKDAYDLARYVDQEE